MTESWHIQENFLSVCVAGMNGDTGGKGSKVGDGGLNPNQKLGFYLEGTGKLLRGLRQGR